jgi:uncharacterized protein DUF362
MKTPPHCRRAPPARRLYWMLGLASIGWLLLRSGTDARRLRYPCQRAALAGSLSFLASLLSFPALGYLVRRLRSQATPGGAGLLALLFLAVLGVALTQGPPLRADANARSLPAWTSPAARSNVFVVGQVPHPDCSLAGGVLPPSPPCSQPGYALRDAGIDALVGEMETRSDFFYRTAAHPGGVVGRTDVVVVKINNQWGALGDGDGLGRLTTDTDVLKGLIWAILRHPEGFTGEVVVAENTQDANPDWNKAPANAEDQNQTYQHVIDTFQSLGRPVSLYNWDALNANTVAGGPVGGGYPAGEYIGGNFTDAYILLQDPAASGQNELSYPKFRTARGTYVSMRYGVWAAGHYESERLTFINLPVLKKHGMAGSTIAWKNLIGFVTIADADARFSGWEQMHDFFWGYTGGPNSAYGLLGRQMALIRAPDLNVVDAIWVATEDNTSGNAVRQDVLMASTDPFAVDWYASEYVLAPVVAWGQRDSSAARGGVFRSATRTNQKAAAAAWPGGACPYIDLLAGYDGAVPSESERLQMNAFVVLAGAQTPTPTATPGGPVPALPPGGSGLALVLLALAVGTAGLIRRSRGHRGVPTQLAAPVSQDE